MPTAKSLTRRDWLLFTAAATASVARGRDAEELSGFYYRDYSKILPGYLTRLAEAAHSRRQAALAQLTTPDRITDRQHWARETLWQLIGGPLERTPLNLRTTGTLQQRSYSIEKVIFESRPGLFVSANLYVPKHGSRPYPGVLFHMGHAGEGKAYPSYQKCCSGLAQSGFVVLAFDPMGQGERIAYPDKSGIRTRLESVDDEHTKPGRQMLLLGQSASRYQLWDAMRALDVLAAHPLVDAKRLASAGQSGGATVTMLLACVDDRLKTIAVSSGNTENLAGEEFNPPGATDDAEQDFVGSGPLGFDRWDLLYPFAPKPMLLQVSAHDFFGTYSPRYLIDGRVEYQHLASVYAQLGASEKLAWRSTPLPHGLTYSLRLEIYNWLARWLQDSNNPILEEPAIQTYTEQRLWAGGTGNVTHDFHSFRPIDYLRRESVAASATVALGESLATTIGAHLPDANLQLQSLAAVPLGRVNAEAIEVPAESDVWIPAWFYRPRTASANKAKGLLLLDDRGRNIGWHEDGPYQHLAENGLWVCAPDVRGVGDLRPEAGRGNPAYAIPHASEDEYAWASLCLGDSLLGQRVTDILATARALRNATNSPRLWSLAAYGSLTVPALLAFVLSQDFDALYLANGLASLADLLHIEDYKQSAANFAWRLFHAGDLPGWAAAAAPRRVHLAGPLLGNGRAMPMEQARHLYSSPNVVVSGPAPWDESALSRFVAAG